MSSHKDINDTRCNVCGLIRPCPCDAEKSIHDIGNRDKGVDQPIIIINHRRMSKRRHSYPAPGKIQLKEKKVNHDCIGSSLSQIALENPRRYFSQSGCKINNFDEVIYIAVTSTWDFETHLFQLLKLWFRSVRSQRVAKNWALANKMGQSYPSNSPDSQSDDTIHFIFPAHRLSHMITWLF